MKKPGENIIVITDRLLLQTVSEEFKFDIWNEFTPEITRFMPFNPTGNIKDTEDFIALSSQDLISGKAILFCILKGESKEFLGCCGLHNINTRMVEIGLWLKKSAHGNGYGTETVKTLIEFAEAHLDFEYLLYPVDKDNWISKKIPEKLGFIPTRTYEKKKSGTENLHIMEFRKKK